MDKTQQILEKIKLMLLEMGFTETTVTNPHRSVTNYVSRDLYCIPQYVGRLGFLIEYAHSLEEAQKHMYGDGDSFPITMGEEEILRGLELEVQRALN